MDTWQNAHVIVLGNEKGGSGKTTTAIHLAVHLLYEGYRVATLDADSRQHSFTSYIGNRAQWARAEGRTLPLPIHYHLPQARGDSVSDNRRAEFEMFRQAVAEVEREVDFLIIDTPGFDTPLTRIAHSLADTLITPINDSLIDLEVIARIAPDTGAVVELGHYTRLVQRARRERMAIDKRSIDWVLVRNRMTTLGSRNGRLIEAALDAVAARAGCRVADGITERVIFRALFSAGLTVFDPVAEESAGGVATGNPEGARADYRQLAGALNLAAKRPVRGGAGRARETTG